MKRISMTVAIFLGVSTMIAIHGCAGSEKKPTVREHDYTNPITTAPSEFQLPDCQKNFSWIPTPIASIPLVQYTSSDGSRTINQDDVTIEVSPVTLENPGGNSKKEQSSLECDGLAGEKFSVPAVGRAVVVRITNNTGHILRFGGSEMLIEDDRGNPLPLLRGRKAAAESPAAEMVSSVFAITSSTLNAARDAALAEIDACLPRIGAKEKAQGVFFARRAQKISEKQKELAAVIEEARQEEQNKIDAAEKVCLEKALALKLRELPYIFPYPSDAGESPTARILPGQKYEAYLALVAEKGELPNVIHLKFYDLTTRVDPAAVAVRRTHFDFVLKKTTDKAASKLTKSNKDKGDVVSPYEN